MHKTTHRIDKERTEAARKSGEFQSRYSYYSQRIHPGTKHQCVYLAGADCSLRRRQVICRDDHRCQICMGMVRSWTGGGEIDHIDSGRKALRCWCMENLRFVHKCCHRKRHNREIQNPKVSSTL